jgi:hypothetical protein
MVGLAVGRQSSTQSPTPSQGPVKVMITNKDEISPESTNEVKIEGKCRNLGPGQIVWAFDAEVSDLKISAHDGPCPVNANGEFDCPPIFVGDTEKDVNQPFRIYVAVLDDSQVRQQIDLNIKGMKEGEAGGAKPPIPPSTTRAVPLEKELSLSRWFPPRLQ